MLASVLFSASSAVPMPESVPAPAASSRIEAFEDAMQRRAAEAESQSAPQGVTGVEGASGVRGVEGVGQTPGIDADAEARARQGLGLDGGQASVTTPAPATGGDMILEGLEKMRGVFDVREARIADLMSGKSLDANSLMAMQMEVVNFTMLVDISSKLTGKATQSFDTLMKG